MSTLHWVVFEAHPSTNPPFNIKLGIKENETTRIHTLELCEHIPDAILKLKSYCANQQITYAATMTLLYPIYMDAMNTEHESTMHYIAGLVLDAATAEKWAFNRTGGINQSKAESFF